MASTIIAMILWNYHRFVSVTWEGHWSWPVSHLFMSDKPDVGGVWLPKKRLNWRGPKSSSASECQKKSPSRRNGLLHSPSESLARADTMNDFRHSTDYNLVGTIDLHTSHRPLMKRVWPLYFFFNFYIFFIHSLQHNAFRYEFLSELSWLPFNEQN